MPLPVFNQSQAIDQLVSAPDLKAIPTWFTITEQSGLGRVVRLMGRCLPHRPVRQGIKQRHKVEYYPGASQATLQVFGPDHTGLTVQGDLNTRYMADEDFFLHGNDAGMERVKTAEHARAILNDLCRSGQEVRVVWGQGDFGMIQRGIISAVTFEEDRAQDMGWELEFVWYADSDILPQVAVPPPSSPKTKELMEKFDALMDKVSETMSEAEGGYREYVTQSINRLSATQARVLDMVDRAFALANAPAQSLKSAAAVAGNAKQGAVDAQASALALAAQYADAAAAWQGLGSQAAFLPLGATRDDPRDGMDRQTTSALAALEVDRAARQMRYAAQLLAEQSAQQADADILGVYFVRAGDSLRRVSTQYHGKPSHWQDIAEANGLTTDSLTPGMVLVIPGARVA